MLRKRSARASQPRPQQRRGIGIGTEVHVQCEYQRYYGVVLRFNQERTKTEVCLWDHVLEDWNTFWFDNWRISRYNETAASAGALTA